MPKYNLNPRTIEPRELFPLLKMEMDARGIKAETLARRLGKSGGGVSLRQSLINPNRPSPSRLWFMPYVDWLNALEENDEIPIAIPSGAKDKLHALLDALQDDIVALRKALQ